MLRRIFLLSCFIEVGCNGPFKILTVRDEYVVCGGNVFQSSIIVLGIRVTLLVNNNGNEVPHGLNESHPIVSSEIITAFAFYQPWL